MGGSAQHGDRAAMREQWMKEREQRRAQFLHDVLNIRPDQETALQAFLADTRRQPHEHKDWAKRGGETPSAPMTTPQRLDQMAAMMAKRSAEHQAEFQRRADAVKRFYAVLNPEQKSAFDALHQHGGMGGGRGFGHRGGPGGPNPGGDRGPRGEG
jgi:hypothetical protein